MASITGTNAGDILAGGTGNDTVYGGAGNDTLYGGLGLDRLYGDSGNDLVYGGDGADTLDGGSGNDTVYGGAGNDFIDGGSGNDRLQGDEGDDFLDGGSGDDIVYGGFGNDIIAGGSGTDRLYGDDGNDRLSGSSGDDTLYGGAGTDTLEGNGGEDRLYAGAGNDLVTGSSGDDLVFGEDGDDSIDAGGGDDTVYGGLGNDVIAGGNGEDLVYGDAGNDTLIGSSRDDTLYGGDGNDVLTGNGGRDRIFGGDGTDSAVYSHARSHYTITSGTGGDVTISHGGDRDVLTGVEFARFSDQTVALGGSTNHAPVVVADSAAASEDSALSATGNVLGNDIDPDGTALSVAAPGTFAGIYGTLVLAANGAYTYTLNNGAANVQGLAQGQTVTDTFAYAATDGSLSTASELTVAVTGTNDTAAIGGVSTGAVTEDVAVNGSGNLATSGALTVSDADSGQSVFVAQTGTAGVYGAFTLNAAGAWTYSANNGQPAIQSLGNGQTLTDSFTAASSDGSASRVVTVTINGTNDTAVIGGVSTGAVTEDVAVNGLGNLATSGALTVSDADSGQSVFVAQTGTAGVYGAFTLNAAGAWTYTANNGQSAIQSLGNGQTLTDSFTAASSDGSASRVVTVTINGTNDAPVVTADTGAVQEDVTLTATGNVLGNDSDVDSGTVLHVAAPGTFVGIYGTLVLAADGGYTYTLNNAAANVQGLQAGQHVDDVFTYAATDGTASTPSTLTIGVTGTADAPTLTTPVIGGTAQEGQTLTATAAVANDPGAIVTYQWQAHYPSAFGYTTFDDPVATDATYAAGINNAGQIVGQFHDSTGYHGYLYSDGIFTTLDAPSAAAFTVATGINDAGQVVGMFRDGGGAQHGFLYSAGVYTTLNDPLAPNDSIAYDINNVGQIVGNFSNGSGTHGFLYSGGIYTTLDDPLATGPTLAYGINDAGQIAGTYYNGSGLHGFLYSGGVYTTIDNPLAAGFSQALGINNAGQVSGTFVDGSGGVHGYLYSAGTYALVANPLAPNYTAAGGLNDAGQIVGYDVDGSGIHGYVATPAWVDLAGETGLSHVVSETEDGATLRLVATSSGPGGGATAASASTAAVIDIDPIFGTTGDDTLVGSIYGDRIYGLGGNDSLFGGASNDTLSGGLASNTLTGGAGNDTFMLSGGSDTVADMVLGQDRIVVKAGNAIADGLGTSTVSFTDGSSVAASNGYIFHAADFFNPDGSPASVVNHAPTAHNDSAIGTQNSALQVNVLGNDSDPDFGDSLTLLSVGTPVGGGTASIVGNQLRFDPGSAFRHLADGVNASVTVNYTIADSAGAQSVATATIEVAGTNDAPVAVADSAAGSENQTLVIDVLANDTDADDGHSLSLFSASTPAGKGSLTIVDGKLVFTPGSDFDHLGAGVQEVVVASYTISDEYGAKSTAAVTLTVTGTNDAPVASAVVGASAEDHAALATLAFSDIDGGDSLSYSINASGPSHGVLAPLGNGSVSFTPDANWSGSATFSYSANDGHGGTSAPASLVFNVAAVADTPNLSLADTSVAGDPGTPIALGISSALADGDGSETLRVEITGIPAGWALSSGVYRDDIAAWVVEGAANIGTLTVTPPPGAAGSFSLGVRAVAREAANGDEAATSEFDLTVLSGVTGRAIDGYISGATVFADTNANGSLDIGEASGVTDQYGNFTLSGAPSGVYSLVMTGGFDVAAGHAFTGTLTAPSGSTVVTPITTLMTALIDGGWAADATAAQALVVAALGLPTGVDLTLFDPVQAALSGDATASANGAALYAAGIQIANTLALVTSAVSGAGVPEGAAQASALSQFALQISYGTPVDLADGATMTALLNNAAVEADVDYPGTAAQVAVVAADLGDIVAANNDVVGQAAAQPGLDIVDLLTTVTQAGVVAQGDASAAVEAAVVSGDAGSAVDLYTGSSLTMAIGDAIIGDVTPPLLGTAGDDSLQGDTRDDTIYGNAGFDTLYGGAGNDLLVGGTGNDTFVSGPGNDTFDGGTVVQLLQPGDWVDIDRVDYSAASGGVTVDFGAGTAMGDSSVGTDVLIGMEGVVGSAYDDVLIGTSAFSEFFLPGAGNDLIYGNGGYDRVMYSDATAGVAIDMASGIVTGDASVGTDTLRGVELIRGSNYGDTFVATGYTGAFVPSPSANADDAFNGAAFNAFEGLGGNDTVIGNGATHLQFDKASGAITVSLTAGTVTGDGSVGFDIFSGVNQIYATAFDDTIYGSNSPISEGFAGRGGDDTIFGGGGFDRAEYKNDGAISTGLTISLASGIVVGDSVLTGTDTLRSIEGVRGSVLDDLYDATGFTSASANAGSNGNFNQFEGTSGNDTVIGNGSTQLVFGDARGGITIEMTANSIAGGTLYLGGSGTVHGDASVGDDTFSGVNNLRGSSFDDTLLGSNNTVNSTEIFVGTAGDDYIDGRLGFDRVVLDPGAIGAFGATIDLASGVVTGGDTFVGNDTLRGIEAIQGTNFADTFIATGFSTLSANSGWNGTFNEFEGLAGDDVLTGNDNTRMVFSSNLPGQTGGVTVAFTGTNSGTADGVFTGHDTFSGLSQITGSNFSDTIDAAARTSAISIFNGLGNDVVFTGAGNDTVFGGSENDSLYGGAGNDTLTGDSGNDILDGGAGNDTLNGANENDTLYGGGDNDTVFGGNNNDVVYGGTGNDSLWGDSGDDLVFGGDGEDRIGGGPGVNTLFGDNGNDSIFGGNENDTIFGGADGDWLLGAIGNDLIAGGLGSNFLSGDAGIDTVDYSSMTSGVTVDLGNYTASGWGGQDTLNGSGTIGFNSFEVVIGSGFNDTLTGDLGDNTLFGGAGNDVLTGSDGNDWLGAGGGSNTMNGGLGADTFAVGGGNDIIQDFNSGQSDKVVVNTGAFITNVLGATSVAYFTDGSSLLAGNGYLWQLSDFRNPDSSQAGMSVNGLPGNDVINGTSGTDLLIGNTGNDNLFGNDGNDTVYGGNDIDQLSGGNGDDELYGGSGNDQLTGGAGNDRLDGGTGNDQINYNSAPGGVIVNLAAGTASGEGADSLVSIEFVSGSNFNDTLTGDANNNNFFGNNGDDTLLGGYGGDFFIGGAGTDYIDGGFLFDYAVYDRINDFDTADYFFGGTGPIVANLAAHTISVLSGAAAGTDTVFNVEGVSGSNFDDTIIGGGGARLENFQGRAGNDLLIGDGAHQGRVSYADLNYTAALNNPGITITLSGAANGLGTITDNQAYSTLGTGTDTIQNINSFIATKYNDVMFGGAYAFKPSDPTFNSFNLDFQGNGGSDVVHGNGVSNIAYGDINNTIAGGAGVIVNFAAGTVQHGSSSSGGLAGTDTVDGIRFASGSNFNDTFYGGGTAAPSLEFEGFSGSQGNDTVFGGSGFDEVQFSDSNALVTSGVTIVMNAGSDANGSYGTATSSAYFGTDRFYSVESARGSLLADLYDATGFRGGNALNTGFDGPLPSANFNRFHGGAGNDTVIGNGETQLEYRTSAESGIVAAFTGHQSGTVLGDASVGFDTFTGVVAIRDTGYNDTFYGSDVNGNTPDDQELFRLAGGDDTVFGGLGYDIVSYSDQYSGVTIDMNAGTATGATEGLDRFYGIEAITGSRSDDVLIGNSGDNVLTALQGNDSLDGGGGIDRASYYSSTLGVSVDLAMGTAADGWGTNDTLVNIENVTGSRYDDTLVGDGGANTLNGADGIDILTGGGGADVFQFRPPVHTSALTPPSNGYDIVTDFQQGIDLIDLRSDQFADAVAVLAATTDDLSGNAIIYIPDGGTVMLLGVHAADLNAGDFTLH